MTTSRKLRSALAAAIAAAALAVPSISTAQDGAVSNEGVDISGLVIGLDGGYSIPRGHEYNGNLKDGINAVHGFVGYRFANMFELEASFIDIQSEIEDSDAKALTRVYSLDGRFFIAGTGVVQPNILLGYAPVADLHYATGVGTASEHGYSINLGAGVRISVMRHLFLTADFRHMFIRHTSGKVESGGVSISGKFEHEQKGDIGAVLLGGGIQF